jgi:hypothetical protein
MAGTASDEFVIPDEVEAAAEALAIPADDGELAFPEPPPAEADLTAASDLPSAEVIFDDAGDAAAPSPSPAAPAGDVVAALIAKKKEKLGRSARSTAVASASQRAEEVQQAAQAQRQTSDRTRQEEEWTELELKRQLKGLMDEVHSRELDDFRAQQPKPAPAPPPPDPALARSSRRRLKSGLNSSRNAKSGLLTSSRKQSAPAVPSLTASAKVPAPPPSDRVSPTSTRAVRRTSGTRRSLARAGGGTALLVPLLLGVAALAGVVVFLALR